MRKCGNEEYSCLSLHKEVQQGVCSCLRFARYANNCMDLPTLGFPHMYNKMHKVVASLLYAFHACM